VEFVVDCNCLFSAFRKFSLTRSLLFNPRLKLSSPRFALRELTKYRHVVMSKAKIDIGEFGLIERLLSTEVTFIPVTEFKEFLKEAASLCPDPDDVEYFALALKLKSPIWSNDKRLKKQFGVKVYTTSEVASLAGAI